MDKKPTDREYIALLEKRDEESRRTIRTLASMLTSAMDRIEELQKGTRRRSPSALFCDVSPRNGSDDVVVTQPALLDSIDVAELLGVSKATALKLIKGIGGVQLGNRWKISATKLDEFVAQGEHIDLS